LDTDHFAVAKLVRVSLFCERQHIGGDGTRLFVFFASTNSGASWSSNSSVGYSYLMSAACSGNGVKMYASGQQSTIAPSLDSGATWSYVTVGAGASTKVACSADGSIVFAAGYGSGAAIWISTNSGANWTKSSAPLLSYNSIASSADGTRIIAVVYWTPPSFTTGAIYVSSDGGISWANVAGLPTKGLCAASSADGSKLVATSGAIYISTNFGGSWFYSPGSYVSCSQLASSADGGRVFASNTRIYTRRAVQGPILDIVAYPANDVTLSWVVPSVDFALQKSTTLEPADWTTLTNVPSFDPSSLRNRVSLESPGDSFYRLISR
jgi:photosystem II stability/assembly factor-like uncharacterized protein